MIVKAIDENEFSSVYKLMQKSFPPVEFRTYEEELALFHCPNYTVLGIGEEGAMQAFIAEWVLSEVHFIEHFAVNPDIRGKGLGTRIMREYLKHRKTPVVLEVEATGSQIAKRRIGFYKRLGFGLSKIEYLQPSLQKTPQEVFLRLMHYPAELSNEILCKAKHEIFQTVYDLH